MFFIDLKTQDYHLMNLSKNAEMPIHSVPSYKEHLYKEPLVCLKNIKNSDQLVLGQLKNVILKQLDTQVNFFDLKTSSSYSYITCISLRPCVLGTGSKFSERFFLIRAPGKTGVKHSSSGQSSKKERKKLVNYTF